MDDEDEWKDEAAKKREEIGDNIKAMMRQENGGSYLLGLSQYDCVGAKCGPTFEETKTKLFTAANMVPGWEQPY